MGYESDTKVSYSKAIQIAMHGNLTLQTLKRNKTFIKHNKTFNINCNKTFIT